MRPSVRQSVIIMLLNAVIAALLIYIFVIPNVYANVPNSPSGKEPPPNGTTEKPPHNKLRPAEKGLVAAIERETRLMGTGDESVVAAYSIDGMTYVFGNATVGDLDFDTYGGFICKADGDGAIVFMQSLGGKLTAAGMCDGGFAVATVNDGAGKLYAVDMQCNITLAAELDGTAKAIIPVESRTAVLTMPNSNSFCLTEYIAPAGETWEKGKSTHISSGFTLDYFDCYSLGYEYIIAARASLARYDSVVFYKFKAGGDADAHFYGGSDENLMRPYAVAPYSGGYLALCMRNNAGVMISVDYSFMHYKRDTLGFDFADARLFTCGDKMYACFDTSDGNVTFEIDSGMARKILPFAGGIKVFAVTDPESPRVIGQRNGLMRIASALETIDLDIKNAEIHRVFSDGTVVLSANGGSAVTVPSGGRDVYILKLATGL